MRISRKNWMLWQWLSFIAMVIFFVWQLGWLQAAVFIILMLIHEAGHVWAAYRFKCNFSGMAFTPFGIGALVGWKNLRTESWTAIMGPLWGLGSAIVVFALFQFTDYIIFLLATLLAAALNLFNLIPLLPLDGGRVMRGLTAHLSYKISRHVFLAYSALAALGAAYLLKTYWVMLVVVLAMGFMELQAEYGTRRDGVWRQPIPKKEKIIFTVIYGGLVLVLSALLMYAYSKLAMFFG